MSEIRAYQVKENDTWLYYPGLDIECLYRRIAKLEAIIATHADPTGDDEETVALILECYENWSTLQENEK